MATCPDGHASTDPEYCDVCGVPMTATAATPQSAPGAAAAAQPALAAEGSQARCPDCGTPREPPDSRFCEACGYDWVLGSSRPESADTHNRSAAAASTPAASSAPAQSSSGGEQPASASPRTASPAGANDRASSDMAGQQTPSAWVAVITADRAYYDRVIAQEGPDADSIVFPPYAPERRIALTVPDVRIGRHSSSRDLTPEIDLREPPPDNGVSHLHAVLLRDDDGRWSVVDLDSTNGTTVNDSTEPLTPNVKRPLQDGDRIHVGSWTTITLLEEQP